MKFAFRFWILGLIPLFAWGCAVTEVHRAAYVPLPQPPMRSGAPSEGRSLLSAGAMLLSGQKPVEGTQQVTIDQDTYSITTGAANYVPRSQTNLNWRYRVSRNFDIGLSGEWGVSAGKLKTYKDDVNLEPKGNVVGIGLSMGYNFNIDREWSVALATEFLSYSVPYARQSITNGISSPVEYGNESVGVFSFSILPRLNLGNAKIFGGVTFRNHPTAPKVEIYANELHYAFDNNVDAGNFYTILTVGAEFLLAPELRLLVMAFQPITTDPVQYYPMFGLGLAWDMGAARHARRPVHPHAPPMPAGEPEPASEPAM